MSPHILVPYMLFVHLEPVFLFYSPWPSDINTTDVSALLLSFLLFSSPFKLYFLLDFRNPSIPLRMHSAHTHTHIHTKACIHALLHLLSISDYCRKLFAAVLYSTSVSLCFAFTFSLIPLLNDLFEGWNWVNTIGLTHSSPPPDLCCISLFLSVPLSLLWFYLLSVSLFLSILPHSLSLHACTSSTSVSTSPPTMFVLPCFMNKSELVWLPQTPAAHCATAALCPWDQRHVDRLWFSEYVWYSHDGLGLSGYEGAHPQNAAHPLWMENMLPDVS